MSADDEKLKKAREALEGSPAALVNLIRALVREEIHGTASRTSTAAKLREAAAEHAKDGYGSLCAELLKQAALLEAGR